MVTKLKLYLKENGINLINMNKVVIELESGEKIVGVWHISKKKSKKAVILAHGITVDKDEDGVFVNLANSLFKSGYDVFRFDFRGHGESSGNSIDFSVEWEVEDLINVVKYVESKGFNEIGLLGASYGGSSTTIYSANHLSISIKCICLWNPVLNYDHTFLNPTLPWIKEKKQHMQDDIKNKGWTTLGSRKFILGVPFFNAMKKQFPYKLLKNIKIPTLIVHGTKDTKVPYEDSFEYVTNLKNGRLETIKDAEHGFHEDWEYKIAEQLTLKFFLKNL